MGVRFTHETPAPHGNKLASAAAQSCAGQNISSADQVLALGVTQLSCLQDQASITVQPCAEQPCHPAQRHLVSSLHMMQTCLQPATAMILPGRALNGISQTSRFEFGSPLPTFFFLIPPQMPFFSPSLSPKDCPSPSAHDV